MTISNPLENISNSTEMYRTNKRLGTSMNESLFSGMYGTPRTFESIINGSSICATSEMCRKNQSLMENLEPMELDEATESVPNQNEASVDSSWEKFYLNKSDSYPKISPSRKIENINIVFPSASNSSKPKLEKLKLPPLETSFGTEVITDYISEGSKFGQTLESSSDDILSGDDIFRSTKVRKVKPTSCFKTNLANAISPKPFSKQVNTSYESPAFDFNISANSTSNGITQTLLNKSTPSAVNSGVCRKSKLDLNFSAGSSVHNSLASSRSFKRSKDSESTYWLGEVKHFGVDCPETCHECGSKPPRLFAAVITSSPNNSKFLDNEEQLSRKFRKIMGISKSPSISSSEDEQTNGRPPSPPERFSNEKNKSVETTNISKAKQKQPSNNLLQEIIQELNEKCRLKSKDSSGVENILKRLDQTLHDENSSEVPEEQKVETENSDSDSGTQGSSDLELNSAAVSTTISISSRDSDSGSDITAPVASSLEANEDDGVFWIPLQFEDFLMTDECESPSTSPFSDLPSTIERESPSISSISNQSAFTEVSDIMYRNFCDRLDSEQKEMQPTSSRNEEYRILDSGYSDRSSHQYPEIDTSLSEGSWISDY